MGSIWTVLSTIGSSNAVNVQCIPAHVGLEGNSAADQEAKRGSTMPQSSAPMDLSSAAAAFKRHQQSIAEDRYLSDPHARVHRVFTGSEHSYQRWQRDWPRDQCVTVAQVRTGHSPLVAAYLHRIERERTTQMKQLIYKTRPGYDSRNTCSFNRLKKSRDGAEVTSAGRSFHMRAPVTAKARYPIVCTYLLTLPYLTLPSRRTPHEAASSAQATRWAHCTSS